MVTPDGTLHASAAETVATVETDNSGIARSPPLDLGSYEVRECEAPEGYVLNPKPTAGPRS